MYFIVLKRSRWQMSFLHCVLNLLFFFESRWMYLVNLFYSVCLFYAEKCMTQVLWNHIYVEFQQILTEMMSFELGPKSDTKIWKGCGNSHPRWGHTLVSGNGFRVSSAPKRYFYWVRSKSRLLAAAIENACTLQENIYFWCCSFPFNCYPDCIHDRVWVTYACTIWSQDYNMTAIGATLTCITVMLGTSLQITRITALNQSLGWLVF